MNISTVRDNLISTIACKEDLLAVFTKPENYDWLPQPDKTARDAVNAFLKINIDELKRILADVEKCVERDVEQSWRDNPDRSGGQFTQDEIDNAERWQ
jgi:hypothetical protein